MGNDKTFNIHCVNLYSWHKQEAGKEGGKNRTQERSSVMLHQVGLSTAVSVIIWGSRK